MATKAPKPKATALQKAEDRAEAEKMTAFAMTDGTLNAAVTLAYLPRINDGSTTQAVADRGHAQAKAIAAGDLSQLEHMLLTQATALQAMFIDLACRAKNQTNIDLTQILTTLALKSASGSRQAITALAELRMPKSVLFAKQANLTTGPQQINNGAPVPVRAEENQTRPTELLEATPYGNLDTRTTGAAVGAHQGHSAMETVNRAAHD